MKSESACSFKYTSSSKTPSIRSGDEMRTARTVACPVSSREITSGGAGAGGASGSLEVESACRAIGGCCPARALYERRQRQRQKPMVRKLLRLYGHDSKG